MLLSAVSVLVVAQSSSEIPEGLMNNPVFINSLLQPVSRTKTSLCKTIYFQIFFSGYEIWLLTFREDRVY